MTLGAGRMLSVRALRRCSARRNCSATLSTNPAMKTPLLLVLLFVFACSARAESAKTYQVTGPIIALTDNVITVQKGDEKWEIARSSSAKVEGKLAVGSRVTIHYRMSAERIEVKEAAAGATEKADRAAQKAADKADKKTPR